MLVEAAAGHRLMPCMRRIGARPFLPPVPRHEPPKVYHHDAKPAGGVGTRKGKRKSKGTCLQRGERKAGGPTVGRPSPLGA
jgi:hypothetical protein